MLLRQPIISVACLAPNRNPFHDRLRYDCRPRPFYGWKWKVSEPHLHIRGLGSRHLAQGLLPTTATSKIGCTQCVVEHRIVHIQGNTIEDNHSIRGKNSCSAPTSLLLHPFCHGRPALRSVRPSSVRPEMSDCDSCITPAAAAASQIALHFTTFGRCHQVKCAAGGWADCMETDGL